MTFKEKSSLIFHEILDENKKIKEYQINLDFLKKSEKFQNLSDDLILDKFNELKFEFLKLDSNFDEESKEENFILTNFYFEQQKQSSKNFQNFLKFLKLDSLAKNNDQYLIKEATINTFYAIFPNLLLNNNGIATHQSMVYTCQTDAPWSSFDTLASTSRNINDLLIVLTSSGFVFSFDNPTNTQDCYTHYFIDNQERKHKLISFYNEKEYSQKYLSSENLYFEIFKEFYLKTSGRTTDNKLLYEKLDSDCQYQGQCKINRLFLINFLPSDRAALLSNSSDIGQKYVYATYTTLTDALYFTFLNFYKTSNDDMSFFEYIKSKDVFLYFVLASSVTDIRPFINIKSRKFYNFDIKTLQLKKYYSLSEINDNDYNNKFKEFNYVPKNSIINYFDSGSYFSYTSNTSGSSESIKKCNINIGSQQIEFMTDLNNCPSTNFNNINDAENYFLDKNSFFLKAGYYLIADSDSLQKRKLYSYNINHTISESELNQKVLQFIGSCVNNKEFDSALNNAALVFTKKEVIFKDLVNQEYYVLGNQNATKQKVQLYLYLYLHNQKSLSSFNTNPIITTFETTIEPVLMNNILGSKVRERLDWNNVITKITNQSNDFFNSGDNDINTNITSIKTFIKTIINSNYLNLNRDISVIPFDQDGLVKDRSKYFKKMLFFNAKNNNIKNINVYSFYGYSNFDTEFSYDISSIFKGQISNDGYPNLDNDNNKFYMESKDMLLTKSHDLNNIENDDYLKNLSNNDIRDLNLIYPNNYSYYHSGDKIDKIKNLFDQFPKIYKTYITTVLSVDGTNNHNKFRGYNIIMNETEFSNLINSKNSDLSDLPNIVSKNYITGSINDLSAQEVLGGQKEFFNLEDKNKTKALMHYFSIANHYNSGSHYPGLFVNYYINKTTDDLIKILKDSDRNDFDQGAYALNMQNLLDYLKINYYCPGLRYKLNNGVQYIHLGLKEIREAFYFDIVTTKRDSNGIAIHNSFSKYNIVLKDKDGNEFLTLIQDLPDGQTLENYLVEKKIYFKSLGDLSAEEILGGQKEFFDLEDKKKKKASINFVSFLPYINSTNYPQYCKKYFTSKTSGEIISLLKNSNTSYEDSYSDNNKFSQLLQSSKVHYYVPDTIHDLSYDKYIHLGLKEIREAFYFDIVTTKRDSNGIAIHNSFSKYNIVLKDKDGNEFLTLIQNLPDNKTLEDYLVEKKIYFKSLGDLSAQEVLGGQKEFFNLEDKNKTKALMHYFSIANHYNSGSHYPGLFVNYYINKTTDDLIKILKDSDRNDFDQGAYALNMQNLLDYLKINYYCPGLRYQLNNGVQYIHLGLKEIREAFYFDIVTTKRDSNGIAIHNSFSKYNIVLKDKDGNEFLTLIQDFLPDNKTLEDYLVEQKIYFKSLGDIELYPGYEYYDLVDKKKKLFNT